MTDRTAPAALLLDLDGTLVDSEPIHRAAYRAFFSARDWPATDEVLSLFTGRRAEDVFATEPGPWSGLDPLALTAEVTPHIPRDTAPEPIGGARELIDAAVAASTPLALVTSAGPDWVELSLGSGFGVHHHFSVVVTARDVVDGKPDPAGYALAVERLAVSVGSCSAVEDSPAGVRAALAAGITQVYAVSTTHHGDLLEDAGAVEVFTDLHELAQRLSV